MSIFFFIQTSFLLTGGSDYTSVMSEKLVFPSGSIAGDQQCVEVFVTSDLTIEEAETFNVELMTDMPGVSLTAISMATVTIAAEGEC